MPTDKYLVQLKSHADKEAHFERLHQHFGKQPTITVKYTFINAYAASFDDDEIAHVRGHEDVEFVAIDAVGEYDSFAVTELCAPWGLERISRDTPFDKASSADLYNKCVFSYTYDADAAGQGVDVYIVDSGIKADHDEFQFPADGGSSTSRVVLAFGGGGDKHGHGTHVASIAAGNICGVAKKANLIDATKSKRSESDTHISASIEAFEYVMVQVMLRRNPCVANFSAGYPVKRPPEDNESKLSKEEKKRKDEEYAHAIKLLEFVIGMMINRFRIPFCVAAGNAGWAVSKTSPARMEQVITVGACGWRDRALGSSNYGPGVDIYAPGSDIWGAAISGKDDYKTSSGTSFATPFVAGVVACLLSKPQYKEFLPPPPIIKDMLLQLSKKVVVVDRYRGELQPLLRNPPPPPWYPIPISTGVYYIINMKKGPAEMIRKEYGSNSQNDSQVVCDFRPKSLDGKKKSQLWFVEVKDSTNGHGSHVTIRNLDTGLYANVDKLFTTDNRLYGRETLEVFQLFTSTTSLSRPTSGPAAECCKTVHDSAKVWNPSDVGWIWIAANVVTPQGSDVPQPSQVWEPIKNNESHGGLVDDYNPVVLKPAVVYLKQAWVFREASGEQANFGSV